MVRINIRVIIVYDSEGNVNYYSYNTIYTGLDVNNKKFAMAMHNVSATNVSSLFAGQVGVQPILVYDSGSVAKYGDWKYNTAGGTGYGSSTTLRGFTSSTAYYSHGLVKAWNGTGYWTFGTFRSPILNDFT